MADPSDPTTESGGSFAEFATLRIVGIIDTLTKAQGTATSKGLYVLRDKVAAILTDLIGDLNRTAIAMAGVADAEIVKKIFETAARNRPQRVDMASHIVSEPGLLGSVKVALLDELNKIVNERGDYGPFWRAQEFGTGTEQVPSQEGRPLFGTFEPSGTPPDAAQRGLGEGHDLEFVPFGSAPGFGRISVELPGRHFLRDGAAEAGAQWERRMAEIESTYAKRVKALVADIPQQSGGGSFIGRIEA